MEYLRLLITGRRPARHPKLGGEELKSPEDSPWVASFPPDRSVYSAVMMLNMILTAAFVSLALLSGTATARPGCGVECADLEILQGLNLPDCTQFNATPVAASSLSIPQASINGGNEAAFCRVVGIIPYGPGGNNTLNFELWLPAKSNYDGRYVAVGKPLLNSSFLAI